MPSMEQVQKMEQLLHDSNKPSLDMDYFKNLAKVFNRSSNRAGKPILKWTEIQNWFQTRQEYHLSEETSLNGAEEIHVVPDALNQTKATEIPEMFEGPKGQDVPNLEFEAKSSTDGAWYDVDTFLSHRFLSSGEIEVYVRYIGFGSVHDEWVNVKKDVRERSVALDHSECHKLKVGDPVVCFQERGDQARYYDAHVVDIQRRLHDIRGCRCLFLISYDHDNTQVKKFTVSPLLLPDSQWRRIYAVFVGFVLCRDRRECA
ncbi:protein SAWADEE HOMEODOMAIN HOMOLOG 1-like isoform X2 [Salvia miltiorrhiza]|uniref:protein SAWADEE HOMEODOMAIN HOMOLOG 1-like isoform X2 n=1 Tax=Salvia miltiorrhiza TaxID=226208 RepID=UPI0025ACD46A|nr:protein SAWADEE HOMEODOMAIN HOMOLOG 1-like isoform X2 [Salvia miltiorrhiza]